MTTDTTPERQGYTPPMSKLRDDYLEEIAYRGFADLYAAEWDRALAAHDAEVARRAAEKGWDECHVALSYYIVRRDLNVQGLEQPSNPYRAEQIGEK